LRCTGVTQVAVSLTATLVLSLWLERLFRWQSNPVRGFWFAFVGTTMLRTTWLVVGHTLAGTQHIALTIAPPMVMGGVFNFTYARALFARARRSAGRGSPPSRSDAPAGLRAE
jgi:hypothetical protein